MISLDKTKPLKMDFVTFFFYALKTVLKTHFMGNIAKDPMFFKLCY
jgi:hypothetical protein